MRASEAQENITKALVGYVLDRKAVVKGSVNPHFKSNFADLADVKDPTDPVLAKHGLFLAQHPETVDGQLYLTSRLMHVSGEWQESTMELYATQQNPQAAGSAITYGKRQTYCAITGVAPRGDDDDGNAATAATPSHTFEKRKRPNTKPTDYITANEANEITEILNLIEDESKRNTAKQDFVSVFGKPTEVVTGMADRARDYAQGKLEESMR